MTHNSLIDATAAFILKSNCMQNRTIAIMGRVDKETKEWIDQHPLSQSDLINYGLHLLRMAESNIKDARTYITTITVEPKEETKLPF